MFLKNLISEELPCLHIFSHFFEIEIFLFFYEITIFVNIARDWSLWCRSLYLFMFFLTYRSKILKNKQFQKDFSIFSQRSGAFCKFDLVKKEVTFQFHFLFIFSQMFLLLVLSNWNKNESATSKVLKISFSNELYYIIVDNFFSIFYSPGYS